MGFGRAVIAGAGVLALSACATAVPTPDRRPLSGVAAPVTIASAVRATAAATTPAAQLPKFAWSRRSVTAADLPHSWRAGCPVRPSGLTMLTLRFYGFDGGAHDGKLVVATSAVRAMVAVFHRLYDERFPIRRMVPVDAYGGSDDRSVAADNTAAFNCRKAVAPGVTSWSEHAYGLAVDVNPVENPYVLGKVVIPPAGAAFLNRARVRRGMAIDGATVVAAFAKEGWRWGGRWHSPDYQHFSVNGR